MSHAGSRLGVGLAMALVAGNMIGSGIYLLPASLGAIGSISLLGWIGALMAALVYAGMFSCLAVRQADNDAGFLGPIKAAFGSRTAFVAGGLYWFQGVLGNVAISLAVTGYLVALFPALGGPAALVFCTIAIIWFFVAVNLAGARLVARVEGATLLIGLLPVLLAATVGWVYFDPELFAAGWNVSGRPPIQVVPEAIVLVLWAFLGLESAYVAVRMVDNPRRNVPLATIGGVLLAALVYISASTVLNGILPVETLAASTAPFADATSRILGASLGAAIALCAALKASGTLAGWILLTSESARAAAVVDRSSVNGTDRPSSRNFVLSGLVMTAIVVTTADPSIATQFGRLINAVVNVMLCIYGLVGAALAFGRAPRQAGMERWPRWLGALAVLLSIAIIASQDAYSLVTMVAVVTVAMIAGFCRRTHARGLSV